mgnify:FL=1
MLKEDRQVIHLEIKETGEHHYFGSVSALFVVYEDLMGIKFQTFRAKAKDTFTEEIPFENEKVIVRKGKLKTISHSTNPKE